MKPVEQQAYSLIGQVVCLALKNGRYYVGMITDVKNGEIILSGSKGAGKVSSKPRKKDKAKVSGLLGSLFGGGAWNNPGGAANPGMGGGFPFSSFSGVPQGNPTGGAGAGTQPGGDGMMDFLERSWPKVKVGVEMLQYIMPLLGRFNI